MKAADSQPPAVFIMGPTASGKTDLAVELVRRFPFEIISVDSALVYRGMNIGTAKPDAKTLQLAPHRLIDILDPSESYSAAQFRSDALREMEQISAAGHIPLLVGGTLLYYRALQHGLSELPPADPRVRARLQAQCAARGLAALYARLVTVDPVAATRIHPNDPQRIQRALEVYEITGRPITELFTRRRNKRCLSRIFKIVIAPSDRQVLHQRIERRFAQMLERGLITEVEQLRARGDLAPNKPAMRIVGYRQVWDYLDGLIDYAEMVQRGVAATRQFAKRQLTWLRSQEDGMWLDSLAPRLLQQVVGRLYDARIFPK